MMSQMSGGAGGGQGDGGKQEVNLTPEEFRVSEQSKRRIRYKLFYVYTGLGMKRNGPRGPVETGLMGATNDPDAKKKVKAISDAIVGIVDAMDGIEPPKDGKPRRGRKPDPTLLKQEDVLKAVRKEVKKLEALLPKVVEAPAAPAKGDEKKGGAAPDLFQNAGG